MNVKALGIYLGKSLRVGTLFQYAPQGATVINRFVADEQFIAMASTPTVSLGFLADSPEEQQALWLQITADLFNSSYSDGNGWLLPAFFQNLLPEGVFRDQVAALRGCDPKDHFEMLAACGKDLPGGVYAFPVELTREELTRLVTQDQDALEMSVTAEPLDEGISLSGMQPKLGVLKEGDRYVGRTKDQDTHIIAKLPVVGQPLLPEVEDLSLRLAGAAGVSVCEAYLAPLSKLEVQHGYDLGDTDEKTQFLAVIRYDRSPQGRTHCEDFAQVFGVAPEYKYGGARSQSAPITYLDVAFILLGEPSMGEPAVHELLRRLVVNEMLGNPDMHLKNIGLRYPDGRTPEFPPAYDIVAYSAFNKNHGHALRILPDDMLPHTQQIKAPGQAGRKQMLTPGLLRAFCAALEIPEKPAATVIKKCVAAAVATWPELIASSRITKRGIDQLLTHFNQHPLVSGLLKREGFSG